jgi:hypothetical protein
MNRFTNIGIKVVPQSSACLEQYPSHRIPKNHTDMCKFAGKHDESYRKLLETFQAWIKDMGKASSETVGHIRP